MSPRNMIIAAVVVFGALWFTTDAAVALMNFAADHEGSIALWVMAGFGVWHLRDE